MTILNRKEAVQGKFGLESAGIEFEQAGSEASPVSGGIVAALSDENYNVWASDDGFTGNGPQVFTVF